MDAAHDNEAEQGSEEEEENVGMAPGFIFMCSGKTKHECYINRVFGLPRGKLALVKKIKPGGKLFLYDFDLKRLYGVYEATSSGELDLEPTAFRGRFPAQVRFKIYKECLPLAEKDFKHAIADNYQGSKFKLKLNVEQVEKLISLFKPIIAPSSATAALSLSNEVMGHAYQLPAVTDRFRLPSRLLPEYDSSSFHAISHASRGYMGHAQPTIHRKQISQQIGSYMGYGQPPVGHRHVVQQASETQVQYGRPPQHVQQAFGAYVRTGLSPLDAQDIVQQASGTYMQQGQPPLNTQHMAQQGSVGGYVGPDQSLLDHRHIIQQTGSQPPLNPQLIQQSSRAYVRPHQSPSDPQLMVQQSGLSYYSSSGYPMEAHQPYVLENSSFTGLDSYGRYMPTQEVAQTAPITGYTSELPSSGFATTEFQHSDNTVYYHSQNQPLALSSQATLSTYQPNYPLTTSENFHQAYADPSQLGTNHHSALPASTSHVLPQPHYPTLTDQHPPQTFPNLPPAPASQISQPIHAQTYSLSSYYQPH